MAGVIVAGLNLPHAGAPLETARTAVVMLHGRGSSGANMLGLAAELATPETAFLAPSATGGSWYP